VIAQDLYPITTPLGREGIDIALALQAPPTPGRYWILMAISAEPAGGPRSSTAMAS
jgi:hypothetical protein